MIQLSPYGCKIRFIPEICIVRKEGISSAHYSFSDYAMTGYDILFVSCFGESADDTIGIGFKDIAVKYLKQLFFNIIIAVYESDVFS